jgi:hypothetical protein
MKSSHKSQKIKNQGSAIAIVVLTGAIVTFLVFTWVTFSLMNSKKTVAIAQNISARYAAESAISKSIYFLLSHPVTDTVLIDTSLGADSTSAFSFSDTVRHTSASASVSDQGAFLKITALGKSGDASCEIEASFGRDPGSAFRYALVLADPRPLNMGSGKIWGDVLLNAPPKGQISGKMEIGKASVPLIDTKMFLNSMAEMERKILLPESSDIVLQGSRAFGGKNPPPFKKHGTLFVEGNLLIDNNTFGPLLEIKGPGTIISTGEIQISGNTYVHNVEILALGTIKCFDKVRLENVTLYSQNILYLDDQVKFSGSMYSFERVVIANQALVQMPSVVFIKGLPTAKNKKTGFFLSGEAQFSGTVICMGIRSLTHIEKEALFTGLFYSPGNIELEGTVLGCVVAQSMRSENDSTANILAGGIINRGKLPASFALPNSFGKTGENYKLVEWIEK